MSRIGKLPIKIPPKVDVKIKEQLVTVSGPLGVLSQQVKPGFDVKVQDGMIMVTRPSDAHKDKALHGLYRSLINNMVQGVVEGFTKSLEIRGTGFKANLEGKYLNLALGYSHPIRVTIPDGIDVSVEAKNTLIIIKGIDKKLVGQFAADIRSFRPVEPYKGKGIRYVGEKVISKEGKKTG